MATFLRTIFWQSATMTASFERNVNMSVSHFRRMAAQCYRQARSSLEPNQDEETLMNLGHKFKAKAVTAVARLAGMCAARARRQEAARQEAYWDSRE